MNEPIVELDRLRVALGDAVLVAEMSVSLRPGEVTALVGESGSGKTTTGLALLGETPPGARVSGRLAVDGVELGAGQAPPAGTVAHIPQHAASALNPVRRIGSVLREMAARHAATRDRAVLRERVLEAMRRARLPEPERLLRRYPHQLSGGQQQRVLLAQALVCGSRVVIADEPTTGQDAITRAELVDELRALAASGIAVLLLTHDLAMVRVLADHVLVCRHGELVERGVRDEIFAHPRADYTRELLDSESDLLPNPGAQRETPVRLAVRGLTAGQRGPRGVVDTLHEVSLEVHDGERLAVLGRSGSGKTTLARCLAGVHVPRSGSVELAGRRLAGRVQDRSTMDLSAVQLVFQDARSSFSPFASVLDQVARPARRLGGLTADAARASARDMLTRVGLSAQVTDRRPNTLSGGELQRCALARALLVRPRVLLCDEITSGLDVLTRAGILDLLRDLRRDTDCALVIITHDLDVVAELADRVVVLEAGHVVETTTATDLLTAPHHDLSRALVNSSHKQPAA